MPYKEVAGILTDITLNGYAMTPVGAMFPPTYPEFAELNVLSGGTAFNATLDSAYAVIGDGGGRGGQGRKDLAGAARPVPEVQDDLGVGVQSERAFDPAIFVVGVGQDQNLHFSLRIGTNRPSRRIE